MEAKLLNKTKMLKLNFKYIYFCYIVIISKVDPSMDLIANGSSTTQAINFSSKMKVDFEDVFEIEMPIGLPPCKNVMHRVELVQGANSVARPLYHIGLKKECKVKKVVVKHHYKGLLCRSF